MKKLPIGLDIGTTAVRLLQLGGSNRDLRVVEAAKVVLPSEAKADSNRRRECLVTSIRRLIREHRFHGREAVMALGAGELAIRNVRMPKLSDMELTTAVN